MAAIGFGVTRVPEISRAGNRDNRTSQVATSLVAASESSVMLLNLLTNRAASIVTVLPAELAHQGLRRELLTNNLCYGNNGVGVAH